MGIIGFRFTHKRKINGDLVGVVGESHGETSYAYNASGQVYKLSTADFRQRFMNL